MHELRAPNILDPRWFANMRDGHKHEAYAIDERNINVDGETLSLVSDDALRLYPRQKCYVHLGRHFYMETEEEQQARLQEQESRRIQAELERKEQARARKEQADTFNASLNIPVQWIPGVKPVLSGLSERSNGDGHSRATVYHVYLQEDLHDGRLHRNAGDFLCSSSSEQNGKRWVESECEWLDVNQEMFRPKVSCLSCLKIASRWQE